MNPAISHLVVLGILNIPVYLFVGKLFFDDRADFLTCIRFWLTPDIISMFRGEWGADFWATMRLGIFVFLCGAIVFGEYHFLFQKADEARAAIAQPAATQRPANRLVSTPMAPSRGSVWRATLAAGQ